MAYFFLTGATGVVGSAFLQRIAAQAQRAILLLRASGPEEANARLARLLNFLQIGPQAAQRIEAVPGDLQAPRLGLAAEVYTRIAAECTHLVHCAGNVRMNLPLEEARRETMAMTEGMLNLIAEADARPPLAFVSTVGVAGHMAGAVPETWIDHPRRFHNTYEAAKAESEQIVQEKISAGLPITVIRPSMVVGDSRTGLNTSFQVFYHLCEFLSGARTGGWIPQVGDMHLDIVPSDYVAAVVDWAVRNPGRTPVLHACAGPSGQIRLTTLITEVRQIFAAGGRRLPDLKAVPAPLYHWVLRLIRPLTAPSQRRALDALPFFLAYLKERQWFSNDQTMALLEPEGITPPPSESYLKTVLDYYLKQAGKSKHRF
jgi:thioester reductase-like protein